MAEEPTITAIDNPHAPDFFIDGFPGFLLVEGVVRITFDALHSDYTNGKEATFNRVVVGRLLMSAQTAQALCLGLHDFLTKRGLDPTAALKGEQAVQ